MAPSAPASQDLPNCTPACAPQEGAPVDRRIRYRWSLMPLASFAWLVSLASFALVFASAQPAWAGANDAIARKLRDEAINQDYLATNFADADKKLAQAYQLCSQPDACTQETRARIMCDRGVVALALQKGDQARSYFILALQLSPTVTVDKDLSSPEAQKEFAAAKKLASAAPLPSGEVPVPGAGAAAEDEDNAGLIHTPPAQQAVETPVPIYVELMEGVNADKVLLRFKPAHSDQWKSATMLKVGNGFGVEIGCDDVGKDEGKVEYFIQALDTNGDLVGSSAKQAKPHVVPLVKKLQGRAPRYPDRPPPKRCSAGGAPAALAPISLSEGDCPPGIAGCKAEEKAQSCMINDDCLGGQTCVSGYCQMPEGEVAVKPNIISLSFEQDFLIIPGASHACNGGQHYSCFYKSNPNEYFSHSALPGAYDTVTAGMALATERIMAGYDRAFGSNVTLGGRFGVAVNEGPQRPGAMQSLPIHLEARVAYWSGRNVLAHKGFRFFVNAAGGLAEVDAVFPVDARDSSTANNTLVHLNAWTKTGQAFGAVGLGGMWAFGHNHGVTLEGRAMELFPTLGTSFGLQLGYLYGL